MENHNIDPNLTEYAI